MKPLILLLCNLLLGVSLALAQEPIGEVAELVGSADAMLGDQPLRELSVGAALYQADTVRTQQASRLDVLLLDGSRLSLDENTRVELAEYALGAEPAGLFGLLRGRMRSTVTDTFSSRRNSFRVKTSTALMGVQGTDFLTEALAVLTRVTVYEGVVAVSSADVRIPGTQLLYPGQRTDIRQNEAPLPPTLLGGADVGQTPAAAAGAALAIGSGSALDIQTDGLQGSDPLQTAPQVPAVINVPPTPNVPGSRPGR